MKKLLVMFIGLSLLGAVAMSSGCRAEVDPDGNVATNAPLPR
jgi:hypothetical protein